MQEFFESQGSSRGEVAEAEEDYGSTEEPPPSSADEEAEAESGETEGAGEGILVEEGQGEGGGAYNASSYVDQEESGSGANQTGSTVILEPPLGGNGTRLFC